MKPTQEELMNLFDYNPSNGQIVRKVANSQRNKSGVSGVAWDPQYGKWLSSLMRKGKLIGRRTFKDFDEAVCFRLSLEQCSGVSALNNQTTASKYVKENVQRGLN